MPAYQPIGHIELAELQNAAHAGRREEHVAGIVLDFHFDAGRA